MALGLDHLTEEAGQFLLLAGGTVVLLGGAVTVAAWVLPAPPASPVEQVLVHHHAGYILREAGQLVGDAWPRVARCSLAVVVSVLLGATIAALLHGIPNTRPLAWRLAGGTMLTALTWGLFAVLFLPPRSMAVINGGLRLMERPALFGQLSMPLPAEARTMGQAEIASISAHTAPSGDTLRLTLTAGTMVDLLLPHQDGSGSAFVASALHDHLIHP
ncbi:MAG: hypothetical protein R2817_02330 [Flavobacteriales bacterium]